MTYYSKANYINYDDWFDKNIDLNDLEFEKEKKFSNFVHEKFSKISNQNLIIGGSDVVGELNKLNKCSDGYCPISDEELKQL
tara:strand:+ start:689 stop:934 length:246 start_codon:yes stop_codon:yes gene_type:complete